MNVPKSFLHRKRLFMEKLNRARNKGEVDDDILDLLEMINSLPFMYTTSSCSGRIMLIDVPINQKKELSKRIAKWHKPVNFEELWHIVRKYTPRGVLWLKQESFIVALAVPSIDWASYIIRLARLFGFKESGIRSINLEAKHIFLDISGTEKLHTPISYNHLGLVITEDYGRVLVNTANKLLARTKRKLSLLKEVMRRLIDLVKMQDMYSPKDLGYKIFEDLIKKNK